MCRLILITVGHQDYKEDFKREQGEQDKIQS